MLTKLKKLDRRSMILFGLFLVVLIVMYSLNPAQFGTIDNFKNIMLQIAENGCFATAYFLVFVCGGFNFACVTIGNLAGIVLAVVCSNPAISNSMSPAMLLIFGTLVAIVVGVICGAFMSFFVHKFKIAPLMVTICASKLYEGIGFILTKGQSALAPGSIVKIGATYLFGCVPVLLLVMLLCFLICDVFLRKTRLGRQARLYGLNKMANRFSGISNGKTLLAVYMLSGFLSAIGGMMVLSKYGSVKPDYGNNLTTTIILIVMLSGITIGSGNESVMGVLLSLLTMQLLSSGFSLANINANITQFVYGVLLLIVVFFTSKGYEKFAFYNNWQKRKVLKAAQGK